MPDVQPTVRSREAFSRRSAASIALMSLACLPVGGCIVVKGGKLTHESRDTQTLTEAAGARRLVIRNHVGDVRVTADPAATEISATAVLIGKGRNQRAADEALADILVTLDPSRSDPSVVEAVADHPSGDSRRNYAVEWRITAPPMLEIDVRNDVGDVGIEGFNGPAVIRLGVGDITAKEIAQGLTIKGGVGDVEASASGPVDVKTDVGTANVTILGATPHPIAVTTDVGGIRLFLPELWTGSIHAETDAGNVSVALPGMPVSSSRGSHTQFKGAIGDGGSAITLTADVGDIDIKRR